MNICSVIGVEHFLRAYCVISVMSVLSQEEQLLLDTCSAAVTLKWTFADWSSYNYMSAWLEAKPLCIQWCKFTKRKLINRKQKKKSAPMGQLAFLPWWNLLAGLVGYY